MNVYEPKDQHRESILDEALRERDWELFWSHVRSAPPDSRKRWLDKHGDRVCVRRRDGKWTEPDRVLLPGELVGEDDLPLNSGVLVDTETHGKDEALLGSLKVEDVPTGVTDLPPWRTERGYEIVDNRDLLPWLFAWREHYAKEHDGRAEWVYLMPRSISMPRGYRLLRELEGPSNARFTRHLVERLEEREFRRVCFGHCTKPHPAYPEIYIRHPLAWFLLQYGRVPTGASSTAALSALVVRRHESALKSLPNWTHIEVLLDKLHDKERPDFPPVEPAEKDLLDI